MPGTPDKDGDLWPKPGILDGGGYFLMETSQPGTPDKDGDLCMTKARNTLIRTDVCDGSQVGIVPC